MKTKMMLFALLGAMFVQSAMATIAITSQAQLEAINNSDDYELIGDITVDGNYAPPALTTAFNGNNHTITFGGTTAVTFTDGAGGAAVNAGLFASLQATTVSDVNVVYTNIADLTATTTTFGGIVGKLDARDGDVDNTITGCTITFSDDISLPATIGHLGGIIGFGYRAKGSITSCNVNVAADKTLFATNCGGVYGYLDTYGNSTSATAISIDIPVDASLTGTNVGGLIGVHDNGSANVNRDHFTEMKIMIAGTIDGSGITGKSNKGGRYINLVDSIVKVEIGGSITDATGAFSTSLNCVRSVNSWYIVYNNAVAPKEIKNLNSATTTAYVVPYGTFGGNTPLEQYAPIIFAADGTTPQEVVTPSTFTKTTSDEKLAMTSDYLLYTLDKAAVSIEPAGFNLKTTSNATPTVDIGSSYTLAELTTKAFDDKADVTKNTDLIIDVLANDKGCGTTPALSQTVAPTHGTIVISNNNTASATITYTPTAGYLGSDTFEYEVSDGTYTDTATVTVRIRGLILLYKFDEGTGTTAADSVNPGTNEITNALDANWVASGKFGSAYDLTGNTLTLPVTTLFNEHLSTAATLSFWFKGAPDNAGTRNDLFAGYNSNGVDKGREMHIHLPWDSDQVYMNWCAEGGKSYDKIYGNSAAVSDNQWHHWAFVKDAETGEMVIYVDGVSIIDPPVNDKYKTFGTFTGVTLGNDARGVIDDLAVYNYALSSDEIDSIFTPVVGLDLVQTGTELTWTMEQEIGVIEYQIVDSATGIVIKRIPATGESSYSYTLPEGVKAELVVVDNHGSQTYIPADGNIVTTPYNLTQGWNLIAITGDNADVTPLVDAANGPLWAWNGSTYERTTAPTATQAIWVNAKFTKRVDVKVEKSDAAITLTPGWTLAGPTNNEVVPAEALSVFSYDDQYNKITEEDNVLYRGVGYWIFSL